MAVRFPRSRIAALLLCAGLTSIGAHADSSISYAYTAQGQIASVDGPRTDVSDVTRYAYDDQGNLTTVTNALGQVTTLANFDPYGHPQTVTDPNGVVVTLTYTPEGWLASSAVGASTTSYSYNAVGDVLQITLADGNTIQYTYDDARRLIKVQNQLGESINYTLDAMGNRTAEQVNDSSNTLVKQKQRTFDELGRLIRNVGAGNQTRQYAYDLNDNPASSTTPRNNTTTTAFDALNRLTRIVDPLGGTTALSYNADDQITQVVDPRGVTTQYAYDGLGHLTQRTSPDSGTTTFTYDAAGNVLSSTDARGVVINYSYDALNRVTAKSYPATPALNVTLTYDETANGNRGIGHLTSLQDGGGTLHYSYDDQGNLVSQQRSLAVNDATASETLAYGYNASNNLTQIVYPAGLTAAYTRNSADQVTDIQLTVNGTSVPLASAVSYLPFGPLKTLTWGNGITLTRTYDNDYQLTNQTIGNWQSSYTFDPDSNIAQVSHTLWGTVQYQYDALDRLSQEQSSATKKDYTLDATGNRTQRVTTDQASGTITDTQTLTYASDSNRLATLNGSAVTHDAAGNQTQSEALRYTYDDQGRLSEVYQAGSQKVADYRYNSLGQRTVKRVFDPVSQALLNTTTYLYGLNGEALGQTIYNATGSKASGQYWFWLDGMPLAQVNTDFAPDGTISVSKVLYLHADHLNTPRLATDSAQTLLWSWNSDAYGVGAPNEDVDGDGHATQVALRFPGQVYDATSQLSYNYYRDYNAQTGRYVQSDPIGLGGGLNTYGYVEGNPLKYTDPKGLSVWIWPAAEAGASAGTFVCPGVGTVVGGAIGAGLGAGLGWYLGDKLFNESSDDKVNPGDKALSPGEIGKLKDAGIDPHDLKPSKNGSRYDLFKDKDGNISVKPKAGNGPGEPTGININNY